MSTRTTSWWTNKRLFWFAFWTMLFGVVCVFFEERKEYDRDAIYKVTRYRVSRGSGTRTPLDSRIEAGDSLIAKEETRITWIRGIGYLCLVAGVASSTIIVQRMSRGEKVLSEAFSK